jgi:hypothetical protein
MRLLFASLTFAALAAATAVTQAPRSFATPEEAVQALIRVVKADNVAELTTLFGPDAAELADKDPTAARQNRKVFAVAAAEGWRLVEVDENRRMLVVGNEAWPFPVPIVKTGTTWQFDSAAGKEEVVARRIGRNELAVIEACRTYVAAQRRYARAGHDGKPAGLFATRVRSDPGTQNGLYWPVADGEKLSPLGDLVAKATHDGSLNPDAAGRLPFHGYYFKILTAQGAAAQGGAKSYVVKGQMSGGFALVAWPATYDVTGVMTFTISHDGVLYEKDLGPKTDSVARAMTRYSPDSTWRRTTP